MIDLRHGDMRDVLPTIEADSVHSVVTDPPYELAFMGRHWDQTGVAFQPDTWRAVHRVLRPGGYLLAFASTRGYHRMVCAIEDAGFEIRDTISYLFDGGLSGPLLYCYGTGFPKSRNVSKDLNGARCMCPVRGKATVQASGASRTVLQPDMRGTGEANASDNQDMSGVRKAMDAGNAVPGQPGQDVFARVQRSIDFTAEETQGAEASERTFGHDGDHMPAMRQGDIQASVLGEKECGGLLQPILPSKGAHASSPACEQGPRGMDQFQLRQLLGEDDRRRQSGMEGRSDLQAAEGQLQGSEVSAVPRRSADDANGERLHHGASVGDGAMDWATVEPDGVRASYRPQPIEQHPKQPGTLADQPEPQSGGAWGLCDRCGKPIIPDGLGTALKPAVELICVARKPISERSVALNLLSHGTGGINVDATRIPTTDGYTENAVTQGINTAQTSYAPAVARRTFEPASLGRWPANLCHDGSPEVEAAFAAFGSSTSSNHVRHNGEFKSVAKGFDLPHTTVGLEDSGTPSRFFFSSKADRADRADSRHPTIKPVDLIRWLVRMVTPQNGTVLDPFAGSGTTGEAAMLEGFNAILIEREVEHTADIEHRVKRWRGADLPLFAS